MMHTVFVLMHTSQSVLTCLTVSPSWLLILTVLSSLPRARRFWALQHPHVIFLVCLPVGQKGIIHQYNIKSLQPNFNWTIRYWLLFMFYSYPVQGSCVKFADCKSTGFPWRFQPLRVGLSLTTVLGTFDLFWNHNSENMGYLFWFSHILNDPKESLKMYQTTIVPHAAVNLGCFIYTSIPETDGAWFCSNHSQYIPIFIPV